MQSTYCTIHLISYIPVLFKNLFSLRKITNFILLKYQFYKKFFRLELLDYIMDKRLFLLSSLLPLSAIAQDRPNIIYICTDQQTATAMSCMGNTDLKTPNMDRLAEAGIIFRNAYCSAPLSGPSRSAMFTGYYPHEIGIIENGAPLREKEIKTSLGNMLTKAGYDCIYAGKWHVHTPSMPQKNDFGFTVIHGHNDYGLAESCVEYLDSRKKNDKKPFFLVACFDNPHNVCELAREQDLPFAKIQAPDLRDCPGLPLNYERNPYDAGVVKYEQSINYKAYPTIDYGADDWRRYRYGYFKLVETVDAQIGKLVDAIDKHKLWENTVIIFTSDHGDGMGAHRWNQKSALYEEVVNIPMIVTLPGKQHAGKELPQLISNGVDFYATICDFAGVKAPKDIHGVSYKNLVLSADPQSKHQDAVFIETRFDKGAKTRGLAVRTEHYKYIVYDKGQHREQLYNMDTDRGEMRNLAIESKYKDVLLQHRALLYTWMKEIGADMGKHSPMIPGLKRD